jgi:uncharacterized protein
MGHEALLHQDHRPWPTPREPWIWRQSWCDLLFAHWPVAASVIQPFVPRGLHVQQFDGTSWLGVVPFRMEGVMRRPLPDMPWVSAFPELNVRVYVERDGKPGVWFLSLDATNALAVWAARTFFHLPYHRARMAVRMAEDGFTYRSERSSAPGVAFRGRYRPTSEPYLAGPGTLEHWLTERYCLYAIDPRGRLLRAEVHHVQWPLQRAEAELQVNTMTAPYDIGLAGPATLLHFAKRVEVVVWTPTYCDAVDDRPR